METIVHNMKKRLGWCKANDKGWLISIVAVFAILVYICRSV